MKTKLLFLIFISIIFYSCDPENDFYISGKIIDENSKKSISNAEIELTCYPEIGKEALIQSNMNGIFNDTIVTLRRYDSIIVKIQKEGYLLNEIKTLRTEWKISRGFMKTEFYVDYGNVELKKK